MAKSLVLTSFKGLSAVVSGGSSGLGLATVERLTKQGCKVAICDLKEPKNLPSNSYFIKTDVSSEDDVKKAMEQITSESKKLDILVNCAGVGIAVKVYNRKKELPHPLNEFERILKVNTVGTFNMIRLCCSLFNKNEPNENQQRGVIINTSSIAAFDGQCGQAAYSASKGAIVGMTLPLARDLCLMGVRVMTIAPGIFLTPLLEDLPDNVRLHLSSTVPFPERLGHPDEFAHLVQSIIENPMLNGEVIRIDGAIRMMP